MTTADLGQVYKIKVRELHTLDNSEPNVLVTAKNTDTLEEYQTKSFIQPDYLTKIQYWLEKRKFTCEESTQSTLHLSIDTLFEFDLERTLRSDAETIRDELAELKREKQQLILEQKLWTNYFYSGGNGAFLFDERARKLIGQKDYLVEPIVESPKNLYNQCDGLAFTSDEYNNKKSYIGFKQPLQFLYQTSSSGASNSASDMLLNRKQQVPQQQQMMINTSSNQQQQAAIPQDEWFELFISGKGFPHNIALVSAKAVKQVHIPVNQFGGRDENGTGEVVTYHLHKINLQLHKNATYTVYTPKIFN